jgi:hypothetical protein
MLLKQEMDARLATRCFYLARALTPSHKTTLPSPAYRSPSILFTPSTQLWLNWSPRLIREAFTHHLAIMQPLHCLDVSAFVH